MFYYSGDAAGLESLQAHWRQIDVLAPQCYWIEPEGFVHGDLPARLQSFPELARVPLMPLLFDRDFDRETLTSFLHSPRAQMRAIESSALLARRDRALGIQVDLETINPEDRVLFSRFILHLAERLHRDGRLLSVAVVPRFEGAGAAEPRGAQAFDYRALGQAADFLTVMTYDQSTRNGPPGPVAGYEWVERAVDYAVRHVARSKIVLGIPLYGRDWEEDAGESRSLTADDVDALLARPGVEKIWSERWRAPWIRYFQEGAEHTAWFEDRRSWEEKLRLVREYHLRGFAAWRLGAEGPEFWSLLKPATPRRAPEGLQERPARTKRRLPAGRPAPDAR